MPITKPSLIKQNNKIALINSIILPMISILIIKYGVYSNIITWTLTINVCLMFNSKNMGRYNDEKINGEFNGYDVNTYNR